MGKRKHAQQSAVTTPQSGSRRTHSFLIKVGRDHKGRRTISFELPRPKWLPHISTRIKKPFKQFIYWLKHLAPWKKRTISLAMFAIIAVLVLEIALPIFGHRWESNAYALSDADKTVIAQPNESMADALKYDSQSQTYNFNSSYTAAAAANQADAGGAKIKATFHDDPSKGMTISDPVTEAEFTMTPKFPAFKARQSKNQIQYPIYWGAGSLIYTAGAFGVKEDILLHHSMGDTLKFDYKLGLGDQYEAKILPNGSLAIYGSSLSTLGNISTGSDKDSKLLEKARKSAKKDKLLFVLPSPTINTSKKGSGNPNAVFALKGDTLTVIATNLNSASYPLSIDPTVQISTISEFYRNTSIESNADFDASANRITRGQLTGGTPAAWTATTTMNQVRFLGNAIAYNGYVYAIGGAGSGTTSNIAAGAGTNMIEYASITAGTPAWNNLGVVTSGQSTFGTWASGNSQGLPASGLSRFQLIAYHGFLYIIGGSTTDTTCTTVSSVVYKAAVQVNGVLGDWTTTNAPTTARCSLGAAAYDGKIYIAGGKTGAGSATGTTDVSYADVSPDGTLTWTNNVSPSLPAARYGNDLQAYNGYLYLVGGSLNGTLAATTNTVLYAALNTDGSIHAGNWSSTNYFATPRENLGTTYSMIKNGYLYISGGCSVLNGSQSCTTQLSDNQLAQINADGSLGQWATTTSIITNGAANATRVGAAAVVWRSTVYNVSGCAAMAAGSISCTTSLATTQYATITQAGQASVLKTGSTLPVSLFGAASAVLNGYIYVVGGCLTNSCQTGTSDTSNVTYYAQINSDGTLGSWQTSAFTLNGTGTASGLAEMALVAANGTLYGFGGYNNTANSNRAWITTPNPSTGNLTANWTQSTGNLAATVYAAGALYVNGTFMVIGGCIAGANQFGCSTYRTAVTKYTIAGTTLTNAGTTTALNNATVNYSVAAFGLAYYYGYIYLCGGTSGAQAYTQYCTYGKLNPSAMTVASWTITTGRLNMNTSPNHPIRRSAAFASNGYLYAYSGHDGLNNVSVGQINVGKIDVTTGNILTDFNVSTTAFTPKWDSTSVFANGNIYTMGGCTAGNPPTTCSARTNATEYFQIYDATNSGTRNVTAGTSYPTASGCTSGCLGIAATSAAKSDGTGYIYTAGGCTTYTIGTAACTASTTNTYYMALSEDGSMAGSWTAGPALPAARGFGCMVAMNGTLYYMGGNNAGTAATTVYYSTLTNGVPGAWATASNVLPLARDAPGCAVWNNRIYVTGGSASTTTYYSPTLASGGNVSSAWSTTTNAFTTNRSYHATVALGGYLFVIGGYDGTNYLSSVMSAKIDTNGDISTATWTLTNDLPYKLRQIGAYAANGYIYVIGGANGTSSTSCFDTQYVSAVNSDGTIGYWTEGAATSITAVSAPAVAYFNGYYYVMGGNNCTNNISTVNYAGEQSQAIRSIFSRYIDLVGDATPWKFVINGTNATVNTVDIEKWRLSYISSQQTTNAFGASTVISPLSFGSTATAYSAIDGSSTNQGVSRYWLLTYDIDQSSSFAFADIQQPAIISYSFYYAPDGSHRLRNGRVFQDQTKQSLDAHP